LARVPSNLNNSPKSGHFWFYFSGITYVTIFSGLYPHSSLILRYISKSVMA
jgi:hypothetical protein